MPTKPLPRFVEPMQAFGAGAFRLPGLDLEAKLDGYRAIAAIEAGEVQA